MRLQSIFAFLALCFTGSVAAQECVEDPPPPKSGCAAFEARFKSCPSVDKRGPFCHHEPLEAHISCEPTTGKAADGYRCELLPVETQPAGYLNHTMSVTINSATYHYPNQSSVTFQCQNDEPIVVEGTIWNGSYTDDAYVSQRCTYTPVPDYVQGWTIGCAAGLPGYNEVRITPPVNGGATYYVVDLRSVRYYSGGWQRAASGPSTTQLIRPLNESYVRVAACNAGGCGPYHDVGPRANPSLYCP